MSRYGKEVNKILQSIRAGDRAKFKELFDLTANHLRIVATNYLTNKANVDDVVSDVYIRVMQYIDSFNHKQDGYNWLCKITQNVAKVYNAKDGMYCGMENANEIPTYVFDTIENKMDLFSALENMDEESKLIIYKRFYLGETLEEIGSYLKISKVAVSKKIKKILKKLKKFYDIG